MQAAKSPATKHCAYKWFIDELVEIARGDITAIRIRRHGHAERTNHDDLPLNATELRRKEIFLSLSSDQAEMLADMFDEARSDAIHDLASFLEWALSYDHLKMEKGGEQIPASPYNTMHHDFVGRMAGDNWPDEEDDRRSAILQ